MILALLALAVIAGAVIQVVKPVQSIPGPVQKTTSSPTVRTSEQNAWAAISVYLKPCSALVSSVDGKDIFGESYVRNAGGERSFNTDAVPASFWEGYR